MATEKQDLIDRGRLLRDPYFQEGRYPESHLLRMAIREQPTVDAVEVVHGRYTEKPKDEWYAPYYVCLECGTQMMVADEEGRNIKPNLCPNCGAKMDGERI